MWVKLKERIQVPVAGVEDPHVYHFPEKCRTDPDLFEKMYRDIYLVEGIYSLFLDFAALFLEPNIEI